MTLKNQLLLRPLYDPHFNCQDTAFFISLPSSFFWPNCFLKIKEVSGSFGNGRDVESWGAWDSTKAGKRRGARDGIRTWDGRGKEYNKRGRDGREEDNSKGGEDGRGEVDNRKEFKDGDQVVKKGALEQISSSWLISTLISANSSNINCWVGIGKCVTYRQLFVVIYCQNHTNSCI